MPNHLLNKNQKEKSISPKIQVEPGYISLQETSKISPYSQEYLSLLARQGRLKCKKFGRTWYTTVENLQEYIKSQGIPLIIPKAFYIPSYKGRITKPFFAAFEEPLKEIEKIKEEAKIPAEIELPKPEFKKFPFLNLFKVLIVILVVGSIFYYGWQSGAYLVFKEYGKWFSETSKEFVQKSYKSLKEFFVEKPLGEKVVTVPPQEIFLFEREFSGLEENIIGDVKGRFGGFREEFGLLKPGVEEKDQGVVIIPKGLEEGEKFKKELESAFADKVKVEPDETGKAGIIKPVFAAPPIEEQSYLYMMVPVKGE